MEQAGKTVRRALARLIESEPLPESASERDGQVWNALAEMYGSAFVSSYGESPPRIWRESIASLEDRHLQRGFRRLIGEGRKFPPNLSEFIDACKRNDPVKYLGVPMNDEQKKLLGRKKQAPTALGKSYIAKMREKYGSSEG